MNNNYFYDPYSGKKKSTRWLKNDHYKKKLIDLMNYYVPEWKTDYGNIHGDMMFNHPKSRQYGRRSHRKLVNGNIRAKRFEQVCLKEPVCCSKLSSKWGW